MPLMKIRESYLSIFHTGFSDNVRERRMYSTKENRVLILAVVLRGSNIEILNKQKKSKEKLHREKKKIP